MRVFRRVRLFDLLEDCDADGWGRAEREDGTAGYTAFNSGLDHAGLAERRDDFSDALAASMERQDR